MDLVDHPDGGYSYVPGISPYSAGVRAGTGHRLRHVNVRRAKGWQDGFGLIDEMLAAAGRPPRALCSVELRCPEPHSFGRFGSFNEEYRQALDSRSILLAGGINPVARTNVAPVVGRPARTLLHAFSFTVPDEQVTRPSFVVSGAGDLHDQADLRPEAIVGGTRSWADSGTERATAVLDEIQARLTGLGLGWTDTDAVSVYSIESIHSVLEPTVLARLGDASRRGVLWSLAAPPVAGLKFEMDARGGVDEVWV